MRDAALAERRDDQLRLRGWHDPIIRPLQHQHGRRDAIGEVDRAARPIEIRSLRIRPDERVLVLQLELVGLASAELLEVGDAEVRRSRGEGVGERERADRRVAAGAPAGDQQPVGIGLALLDEMSSRIDAVLRDRPRPTGRSGARGTRGRSPSSRRSSRRRRRNRDSSRTARRGRRVGVALPVGPPWLSTMSGGRSPSGASKSCVRWRVERARARSARPRSGTRSRRGAEMVPAARATSMLVRNVVELAGVARRRERSAFGVVVAPATMHGAPSLGAHVRRSRERVEAEIELVEQPGLRVEDAEVREPVRSRRRRRSARRPGTRTSALRRSRRGSRTRRAAVCSTVRSTVADALEVPPAAPIAREHEVARPGSTRAARSTRSRPRRRRARRRRRSPSERGRRRAARSRPTASTGRSQARKQRRVPSGEMRGLE